MKILSKTRVGGRIIKRYDVPRAMIRAADLAGESPVNKGRSNSMF